MGGAGFGQGLVQGMQQAQDRQLQMQQLKLQQDLAKFQQKHMETQDALAQMQLQSLQKKIEAETRLPSQQAALLGPEAAPLGPGEQGPMPGAPPEIDRRKLASFLLAAQQAGQDPEQVLSLMSMADPRIQAIHESLKPEAFEKLGEGEQLVSTRTKQPVATGLAKKEKPISVAPGGTLVDPSTGQSVFNAPPAPAKPPDFGDRTESAAALYGQQHYGKAMTFSELLATDPIEAQKIRQQTMVDEPATIAGAKTAANIQEQQKQLLTPTEANELGVPFGTTKGEAAGTMPITAQQRASLAAYDTTRAIMADIEQYSKRVNTASGGLKGKAEQGAKLWGAWTQSDPDAAMLQSKAGELATVARSLGEKGALADKDVARAAALVPSILDTKEVAQQKLRDMRALIDAGEASFRKSLGIDARAPVTSKKAAKAPIAKPPVQDPLAAIPTPKGLTPQQEKIWRENYAKQLQDMQQKMKPKGKP